MSEEISPGGSRIHRHDAPADPGDALEISRGDAETIEAVSEHVERTLGEVESVYHELISPLVHLDVLSVGPAADRPFRTLVTCGMSERPMTDAPEADVSRAELCLWLPADWPTDDASWRESRHGWPVQLLKFLARLPHEFETWLWREHTVPNGDPPEPYDETTRLCGAMLIPPVVLPDAFAVLERPDADDVHFFGVVPLHADEMVLKLEQGADALYEAFEEADLDLVLDPARRSVVRGGGEGRRRRRRFGLF